MDNDGGRSGVDEIRPWAEDVVEEQRGECEMLSKSDVSVSAALKFTAETGVDCEEWENDGCTVDGQDWNETFSLEVFSKVSVAEVVHAVGELRLETEEVVEESGVGPDGG